MIFIHVFVDNLKICKSFWILDFLDTISHLHHHLTVWFSVKPLSRNLFFTQAVRVPRHALQGLKQTLRNHIPDLQSLIDLRGILTLLVYFNRPLKALARPSKAKDRPCNCTGPQRVQTGLEGPQIRFRCCRQEASYKLQESSYKPLKDYY